jgi:hypothetical protein
MVLTSSQALETTSVDFAIIALPKPRPRRSDSPIR